MTIFRVENKEGIGPYRGLPESIFDNCFLNEHQDDYKNHPGPYQDEKIQRDIEENEICGFLNMQQVKKWFTIDQLKFLETYGYNLIEKEVKEITAIGEYQVLAII